MITVFLVDDHETVREGLRLLVNMQPDMKVISEAGDGATAVERAAGSRPRVIVLDLAMPGMTGLTTTKLLRESVPESAILTLTRHSDRTYAQQLFSAGVHGYVLKQSPSQELLTAIRLVASGESYIDSTLRQGDWNPWSGRRPATTERETEVLRLMAVGHSNKEIGQTLHISVKTVEVHKSNAMRKLNLSSRAAVVRYAAVNGWLQDP
jgi:two-component system, NarL family, response regulator NreC